jgi:ribosomal protein S6--L-glutamate ligase
MDILFPRGKPVQETKPLLLEINYYFARQGLGGNDAYYQLLEQAIERWLQGLGVQGSLSPEY